MAKAKKSTVVVKEVAQSSYNPYRVGGGYWASVEALMSLGKNKLHSFDSIVPAVKAAMGANFKSFKAKKSESENAFDVEKRILTNVMVVSRKDYGAPLREIGYQVVWNGREKTAGLFKFDGKPTAKKSKMKQAAK